MDHMVELTVVFGNESIPNIVRLTGPFTAEELMAPAVAGGGLLNVTMELRQTVEAEMGAQLEDGQCFYRIFRR